MEVANKQLKLCIKTHWWLHPSLHPKPHLHQEPINKPWRRRATQEPGSQASLQQKAHLHHVLPHYTHAGTYWVLCEVTPRVQSTFYVVNLLRHVGQLTSLMPLSAGPSPAPASPPGTTGLQTLSDAVNVLTQLANPSISTKGKFWGRYPNLRLRERLSSGGTEKTKPSWRTRRALISPGLTWRSRGKLELHWLTID